MRTINKQKELCKDRIMTWNQIKCSNYDYRNAKRTFKKCLKSSVWKLTTYFQISRTKCKNHHFLRTFKQKSLFSRTFNELKDAYKPCLHDIGPDEEKCMAIYATHCSLQLLSSPALVGTCKIVPRFF